MANSSTNEPISLKQFFETTAPGKSVIVSNVGRRAPVGHVLQFLIEAPAIELHCDNESCGGVRLFGVLTKLALDESRRGDYFLKFTCRNCKISTKTYSFSAQLTEDRTAGEFFKYGEDPAMLPPSPRKLLNLVDEEREYYLKGRKSESIGMGIAAFAYYRRVVENQKFRIFDEIISVAEKVGASEEQLQDLRAARAETQFTKAVDAIKNGIPQALLIKGHNPLKLLHNALSEGLHAQTDEECLQLATDIRLVLTDLVERMALALKEGAELNSAVGRLLQISSQKSPRGQSNGN